MWSTIRPAAAKGLRVGTTAAEGKVIGVAVARSFATAPAPTIRIALRPSVCSAARAVQVRSFSVTAANGAAKAKAATTRKRATTKKTAAKKKPAAKKKAASKKKVAAKKKKPAKKAKKVVAKRKAKKVLTPEEKQKTKVRELKKLVLKTPAKLPEHPWVLYVAQNTAGTNRGGQNPLGSVMAGISQSYKNLSQSEIDNLHSTAAANKASNAAAYKQWIETHTPEVIAEANRARASLSRLLKRKLRPLTDERQPKRPLSAFTVFTKTRWASGDFAGQPIGVSTKTLASEWKSLPESQRQPFDAQASADRERYEKEVKTVLGRTIRRSPSP